MIFCGVPEPIKNGFFFNGSGDARFGATVTYKCYSGFTMTGSDTSTCGAGFAWSAKPTCQGKVTQCVCACVCMYVCVSVCVQMHMCFEC